MAYRTYVAHVDRLVRELLPQPDGLTLEWRSETAARWRSDGRYVQAEHVGASTAWFFMYVAAQEFPYDRFVDDVQTPDLVSTARKIARFFSENEVADSP